MAVATIKGGPHPAPASTLKRGGVEAEGQEVAPQHVIVQHRSADRTLGQQVIAQLLLSPLQCHQLFAQGAHTEVGVG